MSEDFKSILKKAAQDFKLPKYNEIPDVGLYLEQTAKYISGINSSIDFSLTGSMISNYVKKGLISNPVKKQYCRDQIAYLIFISIAKSVVSMEDIRLLIELQQKTYDAPTAYNYLAEEFENVVGYVFGLKDEMETMGQNNHEVKMMLRNLIIAVAYKAYLNMCFKHYKQELKK